MLKWGGVLRKLSASLRKGAPKFSLLLRPKDTPTHCQDIVKALARIKRLIDSSSGPGGIHLPVLPRAVPFRWTTIGLLGVNQRVVLFAFDFIALNSFPIY